MTISHRIQHIVILVSLLIGWIALGMTRWPLFRPYEPTALNIEKAKALYGLNEDCTESNYFQCLPPSLNQRTIDYLAKIKRGAIYDRYGTALAYDDQDRRYYTNIPATHLTGYVSGVGTGATGIEYQFNEELLGVKRLDSWWADITHQQKSGNDLYLTIDGRIQQLSAEALGDRPGAIVVMDAHTGAIYEY